MLETDIKVFQVHINQKLVIKIRDIIETSIINVVIINIFKYFALNFASNSMFSTTC